MYELRSGTFQRGECITLNADDCCVTNLARLVGLGHALGLLVQLVRGLVFCGSLREHALHRVAQVKYDGFVLY